MISANFDQFGTIGPSPAERALGDILVKQGDRLRSHRILRLLNRVKKTLGQLGLIEDRTVAAYMRQLYRKDVERNLSVMLGVPVRGRLYDPADPVDAMMSHTMSIIKMYFKTL